MREIDYIAIHCSGTKITLDVPISSIRKHHLRNGWSDVGYHYYIRLNGEIELGRPVEKTGAHVRGYNHNSIGICLEGGLDAKGEDADTRTPRQDLALRHLLITLKGLFPKAEIKGHRDFPKVTKTCPNFDVGKWLEVEGLN